MHRGGRRKGQRGVGDWNCGRTTTFDTTTPSSIQTPSSTTAADNTNSFFGDQLNYESGGDRIDFGRCGNATTIPSGCGGNIVG